MVVSEELGVPLDRIQIEHADTGTTQYATASGGSKTVPTESPAVRAAAIEVRQQILALAAEQLSTDKQKVSADDVALAAGVVRQLRGWFGRQVEDWSLLRIYRIRGAQPDYTPPTAPPGSRGARVAPGLFLAGDHMDTPSINGALASGRLAAAAVLAEAAERGGGAAPAQ
jgi:CO/xanthine dehydrogenase Mo-binding subunit